MKAFLAKYKWIILVLIVMVITIAVFYIIRNRKTVTETESHGKTKTSGGYVAESFPLKQGMKGENIRLMQARLIVQAAEIGLVADGLFGPITLKSVRSYFKDPKKTSVTKTEWDEIIKFKFS